METTMDRGRETDALVGSGGTRAFFLARPAALLRAEGMTMLLGSALLYWLRGVLATGRRGTAGPGIVEIEGAPHDWLFPRMAAVVHHGGAGTTAEGLRAGKPTAIFPSNFGDQLFWGRRVRALGAGTEPVPQKRLTAEGLAAAIRTITEDERMRSRAAELGEEIRAEDGVARAVEIVAGRTSEGTP